MGEEAGAWARSSPESHSLPFPEGTETPGGERRCGRDRYRDAPRLRCSALCCAAAVLFGDKFLTTFSSSFRLSFTFQRMQGELCARWGRGVMPVVNLNSPQPECTFQKNFHSCRGFI